MLSLQMVFCEEGGHTQELFVPRIRRYAEEQETGGCIARGTRVVEISSEGRLCGVSAGYTYHLQVEAFQSLLVSPGVSLLAGYLACKSD